jgi:hypothetical protein
MYIYNGKVELYNGNLYEKFEAKNSIKLGAKDV